MAIIINRPNGISLPEVGQRITAICGMRVSITPDAFSALSSSTAGNASAQQMSGKLPEPDDNGRVSLAKMADQQNVQSVSASADLGLLTGLKWNGDVSGLLDTVASSGSTATANVGVTSTMTTTTLTTGLFMTAVPSIEENGNVQLQFAFSYDSPPKIESFFSADGNTRNDTANYSKEAITQKFNMRTGQTLMVTGADQVTHSADRQGVGSADFFALGGGRKGTNKRTTLVILITPILLG